MFINPKPRLLFFTVVNDILTGEPFHNCDISFNDILINSMNLKITNELLVKLSCLFQ